MVEAVSNTKDSVIKAVRRRVTFAGGDNEASAAMRLLSSEDSDLARAVANSMSLREGYTPVEWLKTILSAANTSPGSKPTPFDFVSFFNNYFVGSRCETSNVGLSTQHTVSFFPSLLLSQFALSFNYSAFDSMPIAAQHSSAIAALTPDNPSFKMSIIHTPAENLSCTLTSILMAVQARSLDKGVDLSTMSYPTQVSHYELANTFHTFLRSNMDSLNSLGVLKHGEGLPQVDEFEPDSGSVLELANALLEAIKRFHDGYATDKATQFKLAAGLPLLTLIRCLAVFLRRDILLYSCHWPWANGQAKGIRFSRPFVGKGVRDTQPIMLHVSFNMCTESTNRWNMAHVSPIIIQKMDKKKNGPSSTFGIHGSVGESASASFRWTFTRGPQATPVRWFENNAWKTMVEPLVCAEPVRYSLACLDYYAGGCMSAQPSKAGKALLATGSSTGENPSLMWAFIPLQKEDLISEWLKRICAIANPSSPPPEMLSALPPIYTSNATMEVPRKLFEGSEAGIIPSRGTIPQEIRLRSLANILASKEVASRIAMIHGKMEVRRLITSLPKLRESDKINKLVIDELGYLLEDLLVLMKAPPKGEETAAQNASVDTPIGSYLHLIASLMANEVLYPLVFRTQSKMLLNQRLTIIGFTKSVEYAATLLDHLIGSRRTSLPKVDSSHDNVIAAAQKARALHRFPLSESEPLLEYLRLNEAAKPCEYFYSNSELSKTAYTWFNYQGFKAVDDNTAESMKWGLQHLHPFRSSIVSEFTPVPDPPIATVVDELVSSLLSTESSSYVESEHPSDSSLMLDDSPITVHAAPGTAPPPVEPSAASSNTHKRGFEGLVELLGLSHVIPKDNRKDDLLDIKTPLNGASLGEAMERGSSFFTRETIPDAVIMQTVLSLSSSSHPGPHNLPGGIMKRVFKNNTKNARSTMAPNYCDWIRRALNGELDTCEYTSIFESTLLGIPKKGNDSSQPIQGNETVPGVTPGNAPDVPVSAASLPDSAPSQSGNTLGDASSPETPEPKPPPMAVRPIACAGFHSKVIGKCILRFLGSEIRSLVGPFQFGCNTRGGIEGVIFHLRAAIEKHPAWCRLSLDFKNAFNSICRRHVLTEAANIRGGLLAPILGHMLGRPSKLWLTASCRSSTDLFPFIWSEEGVRQGDVLSPFLFCLGIKKLLEKLIKETVYRNQAGVICSYMDDITIAAPFEVCQEVVDLIEKLALEINLVLNRSKCILNCPQPIEGSDVPLPSIRDVITNTEGLSVLGVPLGTDVFVNDELKKRLELLTEYQWCLEYLGRSQPQMALTILRYCVATVPLYLVRCLDPDSQCHRDFFKAADTIIKDTAIAIASSSGYKKISTGFIEEFASIDFAEIQPWDYHHHVIHLPHELGGLNLPSLEKSSLPGYTGGVVAAIPYLIDSMSAESLNRFMLPVTVTVTAEDISTCNLSFIHQTMGIDNWRKWDAMLQSIAQPSTVVQTSFTPDDNSPDVAKWNPSKVVIEQPKKLQGYLSHISQQYDHSCLLTTLFRNETASTSPSDLPSTSATETPTDKQTAKERWKKYKWSRPHLTMHLLSNSGRMHDWVVEPGFFTQILDKDQYKLALQMRLLLPTPRIFATTSSNAVLPCQNNTCKEHHRNIDPYGLHLSTCTGTGAYIFRHNDVARTLKGMFERAGISVRVEESMPHRGRTKRMDLVLEQVRFGLLQPLDLGEFSNLIVTGCGSPNVTISNDSIVNILLDITFSSVGTISSDMSNDLFQRRDGSQLGFKSVLKKFNHYGEVIRDTNSKNPAIKSILLPLHFSNNGRPHHITASLLDAIIKINAKNRFSRELLHLAVDANNVTQQHTEDRLASYDRKEISSIIQRCWTKYMISSFDRTAQSLGVSNICVTYAGSAVNENCFSDVNDNVVLNALMPSSSALSNV